jgi:hypothetical protein
MDNNINNLGNQRFAVHSGCKSIDSLLCFVMSAAGAALHWWRVLHVQ